MVKPFPRKRTTNHGRFSREKQGVALAESLEQQRLAKLQVLHGAAVVEPMWKYENHDVEIFWNNYI